MNRLGLLILLTISLIVSSCSAPFIGAINIGGDYSPEAISGGSENSPQAISDCIAYHPTPKSVKTFMKAKNDTDPTIDPWAGWLLKLRAVLPAEC